jgi:hypothetical protein
MEQKHQIKIDLGPPCFLSSNTYTPPVYTYTPPRKDPGLRSCAAVVLLSGECCEFDC